MNAPKLLKVAVVGSLISILAACGGGDSDVVVGGVGDVTNDTAARSGFISSYTAGFDVLNSYGGLVSVAFRDLFDSGFAEGGVTKSQITAALDGEAYALQASPDFPTFPMAKLSKASIGNCDAVTKICTLAGTLSNSDADPTGADASAVTEVTFTTQVRYGDDSKIRLLGDQSKS
jgi:hypothetical protein